eukprot:151325-Chlamydomonas_euryale.AAC.12
MSFVPCKTRRHAHTLPALWGGGKEGKGSREEDMQPMQCIFYEGVAGRKCVPVMAGDQGETGGGRPRAPYLHHNSTQRLSIRLQAMAASGAGAALGLTRRTDRSPGGVDVRLPSGSVPCRLSGPITLFASSISDPARQPCDGAFHCCAVQRQPRRRYRAAVSFFPGPPDRKPAHRDVETHARVRHAGTGRRVECPL